MAFIVESLADNFNVRRAERFMIQIMEANIKPVLVLNKADLGFDKGKTDEAIKHVVRKMPAFITSVRNPETIFGSANQFLKVKQLCLSVPRVWEKAR